MATETIAGPYGEVRAASTAGGGTALTSTAARIVLPFGTKHIDLVPRNFSTAVVVQWLKNPWLTILKTTDAHASFTDYSVSAQDDSITTSVTLGSLDTLANGDALYVGSHLPFSGVEVDVGSTNSTGSRALTVSYWDGSAWQDISATDGTASGGTTFAQDGSVTWTMPGVGAWATAKLNSTNSAIDPNMGAHGEIYWTQWTVDGALDSSVTARSMIAINRSTVYHEIPSGMAWAEAVTVGPGGISSIQAKTDAGTANLIVDCAARAWFPPQGAS